MTRVRGALACWGFLAARCRVILWIFSMSLGTLGKTCRLMPWRM